MICQQDNLSPANDTTTLETLKFVGQSEDGKVVVALTFADGTHAALLFNANGTFNKALEKGMGRRKHEK